MEEGNILLIPDDFTDDNTPSFLDTVLSLNGFSLLQTPNIKAALSATLTTKPALILMSYEQFKRNGSEFLTELRNHLPSTLVIVYSVSSPDFEKFIQFGVYDYIISVNPDELINMVNKALTFNTSPAYISVPMAEKLLREIEWQRQAYQQLWENYQWYKKNAGSRACDCRELGDNNQQKEPKSTALRKLGVVHCTPFDSGDYYLCEVCDTRWISWEPGVGYGGGWQLADKYEDLLPPKTA